MVKWQIETEIETFLRTMVSSRTTFKLNATLMVNFYFFTNY